MEADVCVNMIGGVAVTNILSGAGPPGAQAHGTAAVGDDDRRRSFDVPHGGLGYASGADRPDDDDGMIADSADELGEQRTPVASARQSAADPAGSTALASAAAGPVEGEDRTVISDDDDERTTKLRSDEDVGGDASDHCSENECENGHENRLICVSVMKDRRDNCGSDDQSVITGVDESLTLAVDCLAQNSGQYKCSNDSECHMKIIDCETTVSIENSCNKREMVIKNDDLGMETPKNNGDVDTETQNELRVSTNILSSAEDECTGILNQEANAIVEDITSSAASGVEMQNTEADEGRKNLDALRLQLQNTPEPADGVHSDCLSPTVNLEFSAVYWTKEKSKSEKGEELVTSVASSGKRGLHVKFAEEENLVTGRMEPAIPWKEAWLCSTSELVAAYRTACDSIGVKPLKKLLAQLEGVKQFDVRSDLLSLRGESLDWKHCETLEEVFKRVQFHTINMEEMRLDDDVAVTIFDLLHYYQSCLHLIMNKSTNLGTRGWQAWTKLMKQSTGLIHLEARGLTIPDHTLPVIGKYLRTGSTLQTLQLENSIRSGRHLNLLAAAMKTSQSVQELYLGANQLSPSDGLQLGTMLKGNVTLRLLDIRNNNLQDTGMGHICDGIADQTFEGKGLRTFVVWNNQLTHQSMPALSKALASTKSLETLNIGHNSITNDGIHRLKDGLMQNRSLLRIGLQATKLSCEGAVALAEFVAESMQLVQLDLRANSIKTGGLMALSHSLKVNQTVTRVDLDREPKKEIDVKDFAEQQKRLLTDIESFVSRNSVEARTLADSVGNPIVEEVCLDIQSSRTDGTVTGGKDEAEAAAKENSESVVGVRRVSNLSLPLGIPARCQTLESPSYSPELLSLVVSPTEKDSPGPGTGLDPSLPSSSCVAKSVVATSASVVDSSTCVPSLPSASNVSETSRSPDSLKSQDGILVSAVTQKMPAAPSGLTDVAKPPIPEKPTVPDKKLARAKRKFTISKAVLPSVLSAKPVSAAAVLFTARPSSNSADSSLDSESTVCIVGTSFPGSNSSATDSAGKDSSALDLHPLVKGFAAVTKDKPKANDLPEADIACDVGQTPSFADVDIVETCSTAGAMAAVVSSQLPPSMPTSDRLVQIDTALGRSADVPPFVNSELSGNDICLLGNSKNSVVTIFDQEKSTISDSSTAVDISELGEKTVEVELLAKRIDSLEQEDLLNSVDLAPCDVLTTGPVAMLDTLLSEQKVDSRIELGLPDNQENEHSSPIPKISAEECGTRSIESGGVPNASTLNCDTTISGTDYDDSGRNSEDSYLQSTKNCVNTDTVGVIQDGIMLQLWSAETDNEATNILVSVSTVNKSLGNNGLNCFDLSSLGAANGKKGNSVSSSSECTDMTVSDCEDFRAVDDERESGSFESEVAGWGVGNFVKESSEDSLFLGTSDESVDGDAICSANEISALSVGGMAHVGNIVRDLDGVNANTSQP